MIRRYGYGTLIETDAILQKPEKETGPLPYFTLSERDRTFSYRMGEADRVYGLGENVRGINKRGWIYESNCTDDPNHGEDRRTLYSAHNFLVIDGKERFGVFFDYPGFLSFDVGYSRHDTLTVTAAVCAASSTPARIWEASARIPRRIFFCAGWPWGSSRR